MTLELCGYVMPGINDKVVAVAEVFSGTPNLALSVSYAPETTDELGTVEGNALENKRKYTGWTQWKLAPTLSERMAVGSSPAEGTQSISPLYSGVC